MKRRRRGINTYMQEQLKGEGENASLLRPQGFHLRRFLQQEEVASVHSHYLLFSAMFSFVGFN